MSGPAAGGQAGLVLLVEDDPLLAELLQLALEKAGYAVDHAEHGKAALEYLASTIPDVIVSDVQMPEMDGLTLLRTLRADQRLALVPVLLLTTQSGVSEIVEGLTLGADDYLTKPVRLQELAARVRAKIERPSVPAKSLLRDHRTGLLSEAAFRNHAAAEFARAKRAGYRCCIAAVRLYELAQLRETLGAARLETTTVPALASVFAGWASKLDLVGRTADGTFLVLAPERPDKEIEARLALLCRDIAAASYPSPLEPIRLTPVSGYAEASQARDGEDLIACARAALASASAHLTTTAVRFRPEMRGDVPQARRSFRSTPSARVLRRVALLVVVAALLAFGLSWLRGPLP